MFKARCWLRVWTLQLDGRGLESSFTLLTTGLDFLAPLPLPAHLSSGAGEKQQCLVTWSGCQHKVNR